MSRKVTYILLFCFVLNISACRAEVEYEDISYKQDFINFLDKEYKTIIDLRIEGLKNSNSSNVNYFLITKRPRVEHQGPEVVSNETLSSGSIFRVVKFLKCKNCFLSPHSMVEIKILEGISVNHTSYFPMHLFNELVKGREIIRKEE